MKRINLKRSAALALAAVTIAGSLVVPQAKVSAAGKSTVYVVTERQSNSGGKTKYSYNGKGLLTKEVFTESYKSKSYERNYSSTTKYSYNKKNHIASETYEYTSKDENFYTDNYGERKVNSDGKASTVTTNKGGGNVSYTYDKKGKVTQAVSSYYNVELSEPSTKTEVTTEYEWIDTRYQKDANGNYIYDDNDNSVKIEGTGVSVNATKTVVTTKACTDNGNGSVTTVTTTETTYLDTDNSTAANLVYKKRLVVDSETVTSQDVTTTNYTYDKKKRVKKAVSETVTTTSTVDKTTRTYNVGAADQYSTEYESNDTTVATSRSTDVYTYNKKGKATKVVTTSEPDVSSVSDRTSKNTYREQQNDGTYKNVTDEYSYKTTIENGFKTTVSTSPTTNNDGSVTATTTTKTVSYPANTAVYTTTIKYDKKGNVKSTKGKTVDTNNREYTYTVNTDGSEKILYNQIPGKVYNSATNSYVDGMVDDTDAPVYTQKVRTSTSTDTKEVELKKNTSRLTKAISMYKSLSEGESTSAYDVSRVTYKVKAKKVAKSAASSANKQQWILQNGHYNGDMGL